MDVLFKHTAKDCGSRSTDWTTIGARILEAATIASAIHDDEAARQGGLRDLAVHGRVTDESRVFQRRRINPV